MIYCHDSMGIGHLRRTLAICDIVGRQLPESCFLVMTGTPFSEFFDPLPRVDYIKVPSIAKDATGGYHARSLPISMHELLRCREACLRSAVESFSPHVMLVDKAPLGVCGEMENVLAWIRNAYPGTRLIFGMRDIEDAATTTRAQWSRDGIQHALAEWYDEIWVYGMQEVFDVVAEYGLASAIAQRLRYMGYLCRWGPKNAEDTTTRKPRQVLVTVGGGTDGQTLLSCYLAEAARKVADRGYRSILVGGPDLPPKVRRRLRKESKRAPSTKWVDFETQMNKRISKARLIVSMGGYNTMCELVAQRKPALIVPRRKPRQEQLIRASLWAQRGAVDMLDPIDLTPGRLAARVLRMLKARSGRSMVEFNLDGLACVAARFAEIANQAESHHACVVRLQ